jgi:phosphatidylglycerophosphatase C
VTIRTLDSFELVARLEAALGTEPAAIALDADGTLWSGDVAEDVFLHVAENELLREHAAEALARAASAGGIDASGTPSQVAKRVFEAYLAGRYPEREVCELMTWCFAGFTPAEVAELARGVFTQKKLEQRLQRELEPVLEWARRRGVRAVVISASPRPIVETALTLWGIVASDIAASSAELEAGQLAPRLLEPIPYAEAKVTHGRRLIGDRHWLASFGDSGFDADMLAAAEVRVAVRPKPSLSAQSARIVDLIELALRGG